MSELHQEVQHNRWDPVEPKQPFDAIIVAGDATSPLHHAVAWLRDAWQDRQVVYVPGNHDLWQWSGKDGGDPRLTVDDLHEKGLDWAKFFGVQLLLDDTVVIAGARIVGCTLWTDYRVEGLHGPAKAMRIAKKAMNDYRRIRRTSTTRPTKPIRPSDLLLRHRASVDFLDRALARPFDGPTVVVTHHAPHARSLSTPLDELNPAYASDLEWLIRKHTPALWVHGHVHTPSDYLIDRTRIVRNPGGGPAWTLGSRLHRGSLNDGLRRLSRSAAASEAGPIGKSRERSGAGWIDGAEVERTRRRRIRRTKKQPEIAPCANCCRERS